LPSEVRRVQVDEPAVDGRGEVAGLGVMMLVAGTQADGRG